MLILVSDVWTATNISYLFSNLYASVCSSLEKLFYLHVYVQFINNLLFLLIYCNVFY